ncbi:MAG TPA: VCBS repeat-containing protein, partial [Fimbriimonadaceae bacterium]|nr:VCBS repeat-containing protein [Fimbriimonadaceae bacterium]
MLKLALRFRHAALVACTLVLSGVVSAQQPFWVAPGVNAAVPVQRYDGLRAIFKSSVFPYGERYSGGVYVGAGDVDGDGELDVITGTGPGNVSLVKVISGVTGRSIAAFHAFEQSYTGGVAVASGDLDGDGRSEVIVAMPAQPGLVKVFRGTDLSEMHSFLPFGQTSSNGATISAGDLNGDGRDDLIVGAGPGGGPRVRIFNGQDLAVMRDFFAFNPDFRGGVNVAAGDIDGDGKSETIVGTAGTVAQVKVFSGATGAVMRSFLPFGNFAGGVRVAAGDLDGDGRADVIVGSGPGAATCKVYKGTTFDQTAAFFPYGSGATSGIFLAGPGGGPRTLMSFEVNPRDVVGGQTATGVLTLTRPATGQGVMVALRSDSSAIIVPQSVTIPAGDRSVNFDIVTRTVAVTSIRHIQADLGLRRLIRELILTPGLKAFDLTPTTITAGDSVQGTVYLYGAAPSGGTTVRMSSASSAISVMPEVIVPAGATQASFPIFTNDVGGDVVRTVSATLAGVTKTASLTIQRRVKFASFTISPSTIKGGNSATGTVTTDIPAKAGGFTITLTSSS